MKKVIGVLMILFILGIILWLAAITIGLIKAILVFAFHAIAAFALAWLLITGIKLLTQ